MTTKDYVWLIGSLLSWRQKAPPACPILKSVRLLRCCILLRGSGDSALRFISEELFLR